MKNNENTVKFIFEENEIDFLTFGDQNIMVNATQMAKAFNRKVENFTRNEQTKLYIDECLKNANSRFLGIEKESDLLASRQKSGTWMHRILALKFAAWLNPAFELWVYTTIERLVIGHFKELKEATIEKNKSKQEWIDKKEKLMRENPDVAALFEAELKLNEAEKRRLKAMKNMNKQFVFTGHGFDPTK